MSFQTELETESVEKHSLVIIRPRQRVTGWTNYSGNIFYKDFDLGLVNDVWRSISERGTWTEAASAGAVGSDQWFYDSSAGRLYVNIGAAAGPDDITQAATEGTALGVTVEYNLYVATRAFFGPKDPLDSTSSHVEWRSGLIESPSLRLGSRQQLYGFNPSDEGVLRISNEDGWLNEHLYDCSFNYCTIRSYVMTGADLEWAISQSLIKEVFRGYGGAPSLEASGSVSIPSFDFLYFLDRLATPSQRISIAEFPAAEPDSVKSGQEWFIRQVRGMVDDHDPVNIDYNATAGTTVNRDFLTHEGSATTDGQIDLTVDTGASNTTTRTYFTTAPNVNVGDAMVIKRSGVEKYVFVLAVNNASKYVDHLNVGTSSSAAGDTGIRYCIGWVKVQDSNGFWWNLYAKRSFRPIDKANLGNNPDWIGFRLIDNWEGDIGFPETFDPAKHQIVCRVYGTESLDKYDDGVTDVGAITQYGGVASESISLLHWLLRQAGVDNAMIDQTSFEAAATNHSLGIAIPRNKSDQQAPTYKDLINMVLVSMLWKLQYVGSGNEVLIGLTETGPFVSSADYEVDEQDFRDFSFQQDYSDLCDRVELTYGHKEFPRENDYEVFSLGTYGDGDRVISGTHLRARDLHGVSKTFSEEILQYIQAEAQVIASRYTIALGDRRAFYSLSLGPDYIDRASLGASYQVIRKHLPGFAFDADMDRERQTMLIESTKSSGGAILTLEDQKGIQDYSGDW